MKKLLLAAIAATLAGCSYEAFDRLYYTDFTRYAHNGIFVSSISDYAGLPYVALGDVAVQSFDSGGFDAKTLEPQEVLDKVVDVAKQKGANGLIGYSAHYTSGSKYSRGYWYATGVAVRFETLPSIPHINNLPIVSTDKEQTVESSSQESDKFILEQRIEFAKRTTDYLIENNIRFLKWSVMDGDLCFDITTKTYIPYEKFDKLYGDDTRLVIEAMEKDARKEKKNAAKNK